MKKITFNVVPHLQQLHIGVKLIGVGKHHNLNFHDHPFNEVAVVLSAGKDTRHLTGGETAPVERGDILLIRPGQVHAYENIENFSVLNFLYDAENLPLPQLDGVDLLLYPELCSPYEKRESPVFPVARMPESDLEELLELSSHLIREVSAPRPAGNLYAFGLFISALVIICRSGKNYSNKKLESSALPALHYINLHFKENISIAQLVSLTKLSRNTLYRRFRELTGYSPIDYHLNKKLEAARELIGKSDMNIGEIAYTCGFCDSNHLIKMFDKKYNISPGKLRKENKTSGMI